MYMGKDPPCLSQCPARKLGSVVADNFIHKRPGLTMQMTHLVGHETDDLVPTEDDASVGRSSVV